MDSLADFIQYTFSPDFLGCVAQIILLGLPCFSAMKGAWHTFCMLLLKVECQHNSRVPAELHLFSVFCFSYLIEVLSYRGIEAEQIFGTVDMLFYAEECSKEKLSYFVGVVDSLFFFFFDAEELSCGEMGAK